MGVLIGKSILVVDDAETATDLLSYVLEEEGAKVTVARDGHQAISLAGSNKFDIIFMDIQMPVCDGVTAVHKIRAFDASTPIIAITGAAELEAKQLLNKGFSDYFQKPIDFGQLYIKLGQLIGLSVPEN